MIIYYTEIYDNQTGKTLCSAFSSKGLILEENKMIFLELKGLMSRSNNLSNEIYSANSKTNNLAIYCKHKNRLAVGCVADKDANVDKISEYINSIIINYEKSYDDTLNVHYEYEVRLVKMSNEFNKAYRMSAGIEELESAHNILVENLDSLINRGENISNLKYLAEKVSLETKEMSKKVGDMKMKMRMEKYKTFGIVGIVLLIMIYFFYR